MNFTQCSNTGAVEGFCLIKTVEKKMTAKGVPYLDLILADSSGEIGAKLWDYKESPQTAFNVYDLVKVRGTVSSFNDAMQLRVERIRLATDEDDVRAEDFVPSAQLDGKLMLSEIERVVAAFTDNQLKTLVKAMLAEYGDKLVYWPAAKNLHHALRGGLLMHTLSILRLAQGVVKVYPFVNADLLFTGVILHDIAKIEELEVSPTGIASDYTAKGNLIGHLVMGAVNVDRIGRREQIEQETLTLVEHMLISHHGMPEFGAARPTMFVEAEILSQLDLLDARIYEMANAISAVEEGAFTPKQWALENRKLYNHGKAGEFTANICCDDIDAK